MKLSVRRLTTAACIAALYAGLTLLTAPIAFRAVQLRFAEALCILPYFTPAAIPGLFVGCLVANLASPMGAADLIVGSLATLLAAVVSRFLPKYLVPLPAVIFNAILIGLLLHLTAGLPLWASMGQIALEQGIACYGLGIPLMLLLETRKDKLFK